MSAIGLSCASTSLELDEEDPIETATLVMHEAGCGPGEGSPVGIHRVTSPWDFETVWGDQPTSGAELVGYRILRLHWHGDCGCHKSRGELGFGGVGQQRTLATRRRCYSEQTDRYFDSALGETPPYVLVNELPNFYGAPPIPSEVTSTADTMVLPVTTDGVFRDGCVSSCSAAPETTGVLKVGATDAHRYKSTLEFRPVRNPG